MTWLSRLFAGQEAPDPALTARQQQLLANWRQLPAPDMRRSHYRCRYVVVDVETTGIDVKTDRLCAIGALAVVDGQIDFKDAFQLVLADAVPSAAGLAAERSGAAPVDALLAFLDFAGKGPMLAYNVPFVAAMIERTLAEGLRVELGLPWVDLAWVMPDLFRNIDPAQGGLDAWLSHFGIESIRRHDAVSDAYVTAQLLQITIASGARKGFATPASLLELEKARRHMHQSG
ncbi:MAG: 3'-5' exonuclease [Candidatus Accumulibacter sp.]|uniref:3'-5' exonuclease n=1 Tax=Candidatus Accumulibacter affinis TaxID=2954384 RepID=A0A935TCL7_9PROT|nr:3'-5' exonuclease [Candidatus Accumulibacter affinis]